MSKQLNVTGNVIVSGNLNAANVNVAGEIVAGGNVVVAGNVVAANVTATKQLNVTGNAIVAGNVTATDGIFSANVVAANVAVSKQLNVTGNAIVTGNVTAAEGKFAANVIAASANLGTANVAGVLAAGTIVTTGDVTTGGGLSFGGSQFYLSPNSNNPLINFDANDYLLYTRATNTLSFNTGGVQKARIDNEGNLVVAGNVNATDGNFSGTAAFADGTVTAPSIAHRGDTNTGMWFPAADTLALSTAGFETVRVAPSGHVGISATPSAWTSTVRAIQIGSGGSASVWDGNSDANRGGLSLGSNWYDGGGGTIRSINNSAAAYFLISNGAFTWASNSAPTTGPGNAITFATRMTLSSTGNLVVAGTLAAGAATVTSLNAGSGLVQTTGNVNAADGNYSGNVVVANRLSVTGNAIVTGNITLGAAAGSALILAGPGGAGSSVAIVGATYTAYTNAPPAEIRFVDDGAYSATVNINTKNNGSTSTVGATRVAIGVNTVTVNPTLVASGNVTVAANKILTWGTSTVQNNMLMLYGAGTPTVASTNVYGLGVNPDVMRYNAASGASHIWYVDNTETMRTNATTGTTIAGAFAVKSPSTIGAGTYAVATTDFSLRFSNTCTVTLPAPATFPGRMLCLSTVTANAVTSASSIVVPLGSNAPGTAILTAAAGKFAMLQSNSVSWLVLMAN